MALEKDMEQRFSKTSKANVDEDLSEGDDKSEDEDLDNEPINNSNESDQEVEAPAPVARRKGRRAVSTGVISTN